jgi:hypothetical protein
VRSLDDVWVDALCDVPSRMRRENKSLLDCVREARPELSDDDAGIDAIARHLRANPERVADWQRESSDTRGSPSHYVKGREVGFYDAGFYDRRTHEDEISARADFVYRKAVWVLNRRRVRQQSS